MSQFDDFNNQNQQPNPYESSQVPPQPPYQPRAQQGGQGDGLAVASLIIGCVAVIAWCCPLIGVPLTITGLILGFMGMKSPTKKTLAIVGIVLNAIFLLASVGNSIAGIMIQLNAQNGGAPPF